MGMYSLEYSRDAGKTYTQWDGKPLTAYAGEKIYMRTPRGVVNPQNGTGEHGISFSRGSSWKITGNILQLVTQDGKLDHVPDNQLYGMFYWSGGQMAFNVDIDIPVKTFGSGCFGYMFADENTPTLVVNALKNANHSDVETAVATLNPGVTPTIKYVL